jgi:hypothetical protein
MSSGYDAQESHGLAFQRPLSRILDDTSGPSADDFKREFYTKCLLIKFSFAPKDAAQFVKVNRLFEVRSQQLALASQVPIAEWDAFILHQLQHPERFLSREAGALRKKED